jgi:hypothetical protein
MSIEGLAGAAHIRCLADVGAYPSHKILVAYGSSHNTVQLLGLTATQSSLGFCISPNISRMSPKRRRRAAAVLN